MSYKQENDINEINAQNDAPTGKAPQIGDNQQGDSKKSKADIWREFIQATSHAISVELSRYCGQDPFDDHKEFAHIKRIAEKDLNRIFNRSWLRHRQHEANVQPNPKKDPTKKDGMPKKKITSVENLITD